MTKSLWTVCLWGALLAGCGGMEPQTDDEVFTQTMVELHEDGTRTVTSRTITRAEQEAELAPETGGPTVAREALTVASSCQGALLRLWDRTGFVGHELCFVGHGSDSLANYFIPTTCTGPIIACYHPKWSGRVRSYKSAPMPASFTVGTDLPIGQFNAPNGCRECFLGSTSRNAGSCAQQADSVGLLNGGALFISHWTCP